MGFYFICYWIDDGSLSRITKKSTRNGYFSGWVILGKITKEEKLNKQRLKVLKLEEKINYSFKSKHLLFHSLLHSSFVNENKELELESNERLEYLGDAVLGLVISDFLMKKLKNQDEGVLSNKRAALVRERTLAKLARDLRLQHYIIVGIGEKKEKGHTRDSVMCDVLEALFGAVYMDGGLEKARKVILYLFNDLLRDLKKVEREYNLKNQLQQICQSRYKSLPRYQKVNMTGPEHRRKFKVQVYINNSYFTFGTGTSIKKAEQTASKNALNLMKKRNIL